MPYAVCSHAPFDKVFNILFHAFIRTDVFPEFAEIEMYEVYYSGSHHFLFTGNSHQAHEYTGAEPDPGVKPPGYADPDIRDTTQKNKNPP